MKYCKKCGVLYSTDVCPKCGVIEPQQEDPKPPADPNHVRKQWIALVIAIPASILLIMGVVYLLHSIY
jgi:RNA polymerase subunit RPABC4/transcription elongation factor Spt4